MVGILITLFGMCIVAIVVAGVVNWHRGYRAGYNDGRADENCKIAQTTHQIEESMADIQKNLDDAVHWNPSSPK